ncbi:hypothetical protein BC828DRAFT_416769 [Blastocladiella britannica]|nr:hypothetical protein BC828DRAFT_416769 [Blastocladiella britannica]
MVVGQFTILPNPAHKPDFYNGFPGLSPSFQSSIVAIVYMQLLEDVPASAVTLHLKSTLVASSACKPTKPDPTLLSSQSQARLVRQQQQQQQPPQPQPRPVRFPAKRTVYHRAYTLWEGGSLTSEEDMDRQHFTVRYVTPTAIYAPRQELDLMLREQLEARRRAEAASSSFSAGAANATNASAQRLEAAMRYRSSSSAAALASGPSAAAYASAHAHAHSPLATSTTAGEKPSLFPTKKYPAATPMLARGVHLFYLDLPIAEHLPGSMCLPHLALAHTLTCKLHTSAVPFPASLVRSTWTYKTTVPLRLPRYAPLATYLASDRSVVARNAPGAPLALEVTLGARVAVAGSPLDVEVRLVPDPDRALRDSVAGDDAHANAVAAGAATVVRPRPADPKLTIELRQVVVVRSYRATSASGVPPQAPLAERTFESVMLSLSETDVSSTVGDLWRRRITIDMPPSSAAHHLLHAEGTHPAKLYGLVYPSAVLSMRTREVPRGARAGIIKVFGGDTARQSSGSSSKKGKGKKQQQQQRPPWRGDSATAGESGGDGWFSPGSSAAPSPAGSAWRVSLDAGAFGSASAPGSVYATSSTGDDNASSRYAPSLADSDWGALPSAEGSPANSPRPSIRGVHLDPMAAAGRGHMRQHSTGSDANSISKSIRRALSLLHLSKSPTRSSSTEQFLGSTTPPAMILAADAVIIERDVPLFGGSPAPSQRHTPLHPVSRSGSTRSHSSAAVRAASAATRDVVPSRSAVGLTGASSPAPPVTRAVTPFATLIGAEYMAATATTAVTHQAPAYGAQAEHGGSAMVPPPPPPPPAVRQREYTASSGGLGSESDLAMPFLPPPPPPPPMSGLPGDPLVQRSAPGGGSATPRVRLPSYVEIDLPEPMRAIANLNVLGADGKRSRATAAAVGDEGNGDADASMDGAPGDEVIEIRVRHELRVCGSADGHMAEVSLPLVLVEGDEGTRAEILRHVCG